MQLYPFIFSSLPLQNLSNNLKCFPKTLEELKFVLGVISDIRAMSLSIETRYRDIQERYRTLSMYKIPVPVEEANEASGISTVWSDLSREAKMVDRSLVSVKKKFTIITKDEVTEFLDKTSEFTVKFKTEGPSTIGDELDKG